ncbi:MAG: AbrB/MazE/SpoVT family DNA-binding domain-containing protein [Bacillota bacterium]|nr:AbrB/MazE/SpoVT family DNA-binding domain-containing protein [Bacillota bacterium]
MFSRSVTLDHEGRLELTDSDRRRLGLGPGDHVEFFVRRGEIVLRKADAGATPDRLACAVAAAQAASGCDRH